MSTEFDVDLELLFVCQHKVYSNCRRCMCHWFISSLSGNINFTLRAMDSRTTSSPCSRDFTSVTTLRQAEVTQVAPLMPGRHHRCKRQYTKIVDTPRGVTVMRRLRTPNGEAGWSEYHSLSVWTLPKNER